MDDKNKNGLPTSPVVKKAIRLSVGGEQAFKAEKKEIDPEIAKMASRSLHGTVAKAKVLNDEDVEATAEKVVVEPPAPVAPEVEEFDIRQTDIRDTTHISAEEAEAIKAVASKAEEMQKAEFLKKKLDEVLEELGKTIAINEKLEEDLKMFVSIADELLEDLPEGSIADFMKTSSADFYRKIVEKYKA